MFETYTLPAEVRAQERLWLQSVEVDEGSYLPNCQLNIVIALHTLSLLVCIFINTTAYYLGGYEPSFLSPKELPGMVKQKKIIVFHV